MAPEPDGSFLLPLLTATPGIEHGGNWILQIFILLLLIFVNAFFSASEIAIISLNDNKIRKLAEDGHKRAAKVLRLTKNSSNFLATIQVGVTFAGFLTSATAAQSFSGSLSAVFMSIAPGVSIGMVQTISTILITIILAFFNLVLGELVPKRIALQKAEKLSFAVIGTLEFISKIFKPFIRLLSAATNLILKMFGVDPNTHEQIITEEEILMLVDAGEEKGVIEESAKDMIANIFEFDDTLANEVMTHRTDVTALECTDSLQEAVDLAISSGYSRIPVYEEDLDTILGILYVKDLLKYVGSPVVPEMTVQAIMRPALFVPEGKKCSALFAEMTENHTQIAIIADEYGGTEGLVTMEDLVEAIVGNIQDEYDNEEEDISQVSENAFTVEGTTDIDEVSDLTGVEFPEGDYDTIAGFMVSRLGRIPMPGEHPRVEFGSISLSVEQVEDRRISKILLVKNKTDE